MNSDISPAAARPALGTVVSGAENPADWIRSMAPHGFECWEVVFSLKHQPQVPDLLALAGPVKAAADETGTRISAVGVYGNPLRYDAAGEAARDGLRRAIAAAAAFGADVVSCFAGRLPGTAVPESIPRFAEVFAPLSALAADAGVRIAFENCLQGGTWQRGDWNMAHHPAAWELMFNAVPSPVLGLEWEPCHQMCQLIDPLPQLRQWLPRIWHVHGKDAQIRQDVIARSGVLGPEPFAFHRFPGLGQTDWREILTLLREGGYSGTIDIEGWHDPEFNGEREIEGQVAALRYLQGCRAAL